MARGKEPTEQELAAKKHNPPKLKVGDEVIVIAGKEKGKRGKLRFIDKKSDRVFVEGLNKRKRYQRPTQENPQGGVLEIEGGMHISNVQYYDSKAKQGKRLGYSVEGDRKARVMRKAGETTEIKEK